MVFLKSFMVEACQGTPIPDRRPAGLMAENPQPAVISPGPAAVYLWGFSFPDGSNRYQVPRKEPVSILAHPKERMKIWGNSSNSGDSPMIRHHRSVSLTWFTVKHWQMGMLAQARKNQGCYLFTFSTTTRFPTDLTSVCIPYVDGVKKNVSGTHFC